MWIRDPRDSKDVTDQFFSRTNAENGRSGGSPTLRKLTISDPSARPSGYNWCAALATRVVRKENKVISEKKAKGADTSALADTCVSLDEEKKL